MNSLVLFNRSINGRSFFPLFIALGFCLLTLNSTIGQQLILKTAPEAQVAFYVKDIDSGDILKDYNSGLLMTPASVTKIITTTTALDILGSDFQYNTKIFSQGEVINGTLNGDLIVIGAGDPTFGSSYFSQCSAEVVINKIIESLKNAGIKHINGKIIIDTSIISEPRYPAGRLWEDMGNYYGAPPSGLTWRDNTFEVYLSSPSDEGKLCKVESANTKISALEFVSYVRSANNQKDSAYIYGYPGLSKWEIRGTIPVNRSHFSIKGAIPDPAFQFASEITSLLSDSNDIEIIISNNQPIKISDRSNLLLEIRSPYLSEIVSVINHVSHNLMADHLFLSLGNTNKTAGDNWINSANLVINHWRKQGLTKAIRLRDGSGLSPKNLISPDYLVDIITKTYLGKNNSFFESSLAVGGKNGTLSHIWQQPKWVGRVRAKSGSMEGVLCYTGYIKTIGNRNLAFCVMVNNFITSFKTVRGAIETEIGAIIDNY